MLLLHSLSLSSSFSLVPLDCHPPHHTFSSTSPRRCHAAAMPLGGLRELNGEPASQLCNQ